MRPKADNIFSCVMADVLRPTFLIDVSPSMFDILDDIKDHLIREITKKISRNDKYLFNIIAFGDTVKPWASSVLPCSNQNVSIASEWIRNLECSESKTANLEDAILHAFNDTKTDGIFLITNGLSSQLSSIILENVQELFHRFCPVHCIYLKGSENDILALTFLKDLATLTNGTAKCITLKKNGLVKDVKEVFPDLYARSAFQVTHGSENESSEEEDTKKDRFNDSYSKKKSSSDFMKMNDVSLLEERSFSTQPTLAAFSMIDVKVLAKNFSDGLYYLGKVVHVSKDEDFCIEFDVCSAFKRRYKQQNTHLRDIIAYEDAIRHDICFGDKVLAPFMADGSYAPATVVETNDQSYCQDDEDNMILVTFYNGETSAIKTGKSIWISDVFYERIRRELFYPESLRKSSTFPTNKMNDFPPKAAPVSIRTSQHVSGDLLNEKIERQIEEGKDLLRKLKLDHLGHRKTLQFAGELEQIDDENERGKRKLKFRRRTAEPDHRLHTSSSSPLSDKELPISFVKPKKEAWILADQTASDSIVTDEKKPSVSKNQIKEEGYHKHRLELLNHWEKNKNTPKYAPFVCEPQKNVEHKHSEHESSEGVKETKAKRLDRRRVRVPRKKQSGRPLQKNQFSQPRPKANEYQTFDGVNIPRQTDRKFIRNGLNESWTPEKSTNNWERGERYNIITNEPLEGYSTNFVNGFGQRDLNIHIKDQAKTERRKAMREEREQKNFDAELEKEKINKSRQDYRRIDKERRQERRRDDLRQFLEGERKNQKQRQEIRESVERFYKEKEENAQRYKYERIEVMQKKRNNYHERKLQFQNGVLEYQVKSPENKATHEDKKKNAVEVALENEIKAQELKLERLRKIHDKRLTKEFTRRDRSFKSTDLNSHVKDITRQRERANILP